MITVIGLGFVGLTTGLGFAKKGFKTYGIDINQSRLNKLKNYEIPFHEPHLKEVLEETLGESFYLDVPLEEAVKNSEAIFLCVGTPSAPDGSADLSYILGAIDQILAVESKDFKVIITKSTVPPSTVSKKVIPHINAKLAELDRKIGFASNPEFLREGYCWEDFIEPDRIVIGVEDEVSKEILDKIYKPFNAPIHYVSYNSAEFIKYLSNTLLSTLISYSNEMSMVADAIGDIDVPKAFRILHEDKRWSGNPANMASYVYPGCGYGGYCLPKDTSALYSISKENGFTPEVLGGNLEINEKVKDFVVDKITAETSPSDTIGILGLAFKTGSDDVRLTPSKDVIAKLIEKGYSKIIAYDPLANGTFQEEYPDLKIEYFDNLEALLEKTDNVAILTGWKEFKEKKDLIQKKKVFDYRYIY
ncbi:UDP-glucose dehydrogenase family protein [Flexithrix dorotheae]|uniref:UDP-glucose dehydrogenase family protein n=1 Tax=Flexithrix dorotheae TaxID=70993 RepID=UPI0003682E96|nr:nucleotide sugar dehydrogenase [Flexithrix dorotheae]